MSLFSGRELLPHRVWTDGEPDLSVNVCDRPENYEKLLEDFTPENSEDE